MVTCSVCFVLRMAMLIVKQLSIHDWFIGKEDPVMLFTLKWFALSDLLPRVVPLVSFLLLMRRPLSTPLSRQASGNPASPFASPVATPTAPADSPSPGATQKQPPQRRGVRGGARSPVPRQTFHLAPHHCLIKRTDSGVRIPGVALTWRMT